jgi:ribosome-binding ATPase
MKLSIGIVGMPNVGKSTLFQVLTRKNILIANYPFATIDPNVGVVEVPDERLAKLAALSHSKKIVPAVIEFYDIAGLVKGANTGEGLGNQFLTHIRECQAIVVVLRIFKDSDVIHVESSVDPARDMDIINTELILKDIETVDKRLVSLEKEARTGDKKAVKNLPVLREVKEALSRGDLAVIYRDAEIVKELQLLTAKKQLYLLNGDEADIPNGLVEKIKSLSAPSMGSGQGDYIVENVALADSVPQLITKAYEILGLISFLTTGEDETRAWTVRKGTLAPEAAGTIHTDFERKFIRAEVISTEKLLEVGSWTKAKEKGLVRLEGKEYIVQDGDVVEIRHG